MPRHRRTTRSRTCAFTLIELTASLAIMAILLVAVAHIAKSAVADARDTTWSEPISRSLAQGLVDGDLVNATRVDQFDQGITLWAPAALSRDTLARTNMACVVSYRLEQIQGQSWLVRTQDPVPGGRASSFRLPLASRVSQLLLTVAAPYSEPATPTPSTPSAPNTATTSTDRAADIKRDPPCRARLTIVWEGDAHG